MDGQSARSAVCVDILRLIPSVLLKLRHQPLHWNDGHTRTKQWANNWFRMIAFDYGLDFDETRSFEVCFVEPSLLQGRFPCGWKGKPHRKANLRYYRNPWEGVTEADFVGDAQLIVF